MLRAAITGLALLLLPACAHAQEEYAPRPDLPIVRATANVIVEALPESRYRDWGYGWGAVSIRVSRFVHWHIYEPDRRDRPADAIVRRNGWIDGEGTNVGVSVFGDDDSVTLLSFEFDDFHALDLLEALRAAGAEVSFQADYESYSEHIVTPPGREAGLLTTRRVCTPEGSRAARRCHNEAELTFAFE
ncbi:MAG TPA: hypothetical protein VEA80_19565 [Vitreimonas sp.]|uniref:hypothetical protein n=1 Tax=Vitreimonas sp. TaxID=3069702 RepID=UPI002D5A5DD9|nr:hypothetical protein [Vitreimonas sp.]HYD89689.1 hypothetical protein [Vitreimonas sp.]